jgi:spore germination protein
MFFPGLLVAVVFGLLAAALRVYFALQFPKTSPIGAMQDVLGRPLGWLVGGWGICYHLAVAAACLRYFGDLVNSYFLPRTPMEATMLLLLGAVVFINWHGLAAVARFLAIAFVPTILVVIGAYLMAATHLTEWDAVVPAARFSLPATLAGAWSIIYLFIGLEEVLFVLPLVDQPKRPYLWALAPVLANGLVLVVVLTVTLGVLGLEPTTLLHYPGVSALRVLRLPGLLVERFGGLIALTWTALLIAYMSVRFLTIPMGMAQLFRLSVAHYRPFLLPTALITFYLARLPGSVQDMDNLLRYWIGPLGAITLTSILLLTLAVGRIRGMGRGA